MRQHALLSASGSNKWLNCPPSAMLESTFPDETSEFAEEGTRAHELCEKLVNGEEIVCSDYEREMLNSAREYREYINSLVIGHKGKPTLKIEQKVDFSKWVPDSFGTCDCVIISGSHIDIVDFKYGKGVPVSAIRNSQMMLYALGVISMFEDLADFETVKMHIFQPRLDNISAYEMEVNELLDWGNQIKPTALLAAKGEGEFKQGEHCKFCKAKGLCKARSEFNLISENDMFKYDRDAHILNNDELGEVLKRAEHLKAWISDVEDVVTQKLLNQENVKNFKLVAGRSIRQWVTPEKGDAALGRLIDSGIDEHILYERKPLTISQLEKILGKKEFNTLVGEYIVTPMGKPTLVSVDDKRQEYFSSLATNEFNVIGE